MYYLVETLVDPFEWIATLMILVLIPAIFFYAGYVVGKRDGIYKGRIQQSKRFFHFIGQSLRK